MVISGLICDAFLRLNCTSNFFVSAVVTRPDIDGKMNVLKKKRVPKLRMAKTLVMILLLATFITHGSARELMKHVAGNHVEAFDEGILKQENRKLGTLFRDDKTKWSPPSVSRSSDRSHIPSTGN